MVQLHTFLLLVGLCHVHYHSNRYARYGQIPATINTALRTLPCFRSKISGDQQRANCTQHLPQIVPVELRSYIRGYPVLIGQNENQ